MRYYFASAYERRAELALNAEVLMRVGIGAEISSTWLVNDEGVDDSGLSAGSLVTDEDIEAAWEFGRRDIDDLKCSDAIVSFTGHGTRGGRHVEHGFVMAMLDQFSGPMRLIVIGPREHVFHCHPVTEQYDSWTTFLIHEIDRHREEATK